jgi:hypothetical protein
LRRSLPAQWCPPSSGYRPSRLTSAPRFGSWLSPALRSEAWRRSSSRQDRPARSRRCRRRRLRGSPRCSSRPGEGSRCRCPVRRRLACLCPARRFPVRRFPASRARVEAAAVRRPAARRRWPDRPLPLRPLLPLRTRTGPAAARRADRLRRRRRTTRAHVRPRPSLRDALNPRRRSLPHGPLRRFRPNTQNRRSPNRTSRASLRSRTTHPRPRPKPPVRPGTAGATVRATGKGKTRSKPLRAGQWSELLSGERGEPGLFAGLLGAHRSPARQTE